MTRNELIALLNNVPENVEVKIYQRAHCCCGDCFLPRDGEDDACSLDYYASWKDQEAYILIS